MRQAPRISGTGRQSLLLGTALATTLLLGSLLTPSPAAAQVITCVGDVGPITHLGEVYSIDCVNTELRTNNTGNAIELSTDYAGKYVDLDNTGRLIASEHGIYTLTEKADSRIDILNRGDITAGVGGTFVEAAGIMAITEAGGSQIVIKSYNGIAASVGDDDDSKSFGISAETTGVGSFVDIKNQGDIEVAAGDGKYAGAYGIHAETGGDGSHILIDNRANIEAAVGDNFRARALGIYASSQGAGSYLRIESQSAIEVTAGDGDQAVAAGIAAATGDDGSFIRIENRSDIEAAIGDGEDALAVGIVAFAGGPNSYLRIENEGGIAVASEGDATLGDFSTAGIFGITAGTGSELTIINRGGIAVTTLGAEALGTGIYAGTFEGGSPILIQNSADMTVDTFGNLARAHGISARGRDADSSIEIVNRNAVVVTTRGAEAHAYGIFAEVTGANSAIKIENFGRLDSKAGPEADAYGIRAYSANLAVGAGGNAGIVIENSGSIAAFSAGTAFGQGQGFGIDATTTGDATGNASNVGIVITNKGNIDASHIGISGETLGDATGDGSNAGMRIENAAAIKAGLSGIDVLTQGAADGNNSNAGIALVNSGNIAVEGDFSPYDIYGIRVFTLGDANGAASNAGIVIENSAHVSALSTGAERAYALIAVTRGDAGNRSNTGIFIDNKGDVTASNDAVVAITTGDAVGVASNAGIVVVNAGRISGTYGIFARTSGVAAGPDSNVGIFIDNHGDITGRDYGIWAATLGYATGPNATADIRIENSASLRGGIAGIFADSSTGTTIVNTGSISAASLRAIDTYGASTTIHNAGRITGFVDLTDNNDRFFNQAGGVFETKGESNFGAGNDLFRNEAGGTVLAASNPRVRETSSFTNLTRFENRGLISMADGRVGDTFEISNTSPEARDLAFVASGDSTLAIDAFLGGPGSVADEFIVNGPISGKTLLRVNNINPGLGLAGAVIPVVLANGKVKSDTVYLPQPIDTGFFQYDLFFRPTTSGIFELRSFIGPGALLLPQLITGAHDIWHQGSSTWFDRTADLRVLLAGGAAPTAYDPNAGTGYANGAAAGPAAFTPAVWARGAGAWLDRDATETVTAFGNTYRFDLGRDLDVLDWQMGLDLGTRDLMSPGDILVFGLLGGFVGASLDYDRIARHFDFSGGQVGGYATYLNGGLFVDTLLNAHLLELETRSLGFANSLDANTLGLRTDAGYRFGSFSGGAFIEPLATIAVLWTDIDGFANGGNRVSFDDEANVRGRLGLRVGTSYPVWTGTTMEPFVIGSLWGNLSGDNQVTLTSAGTTFRLEDDLDDVWGEVSAGVNFFNPSAQTAVFAKLDVTFGDDVDGIGGKAGMRVSW